MPSHHSQATNVRHRPFHTVALGIVFLLLGFVVTSAREQPPVQSARLSEGIAPSGSVFQTTP